MYAIRNITLFFLLTIILIVGYMCVLDVAYAQDTQEKIEYQSMTNMPLPANFGKSEVETTGDFVNMIYALSISVAALLAVIRIIYGGVQYMLTDVVTSKAEAKKTIYGAILGLVIVISAVFILNIINPRLTVINLFTNLQAVSVRQAGVEGPAVGRPVPPTAQEAARQTLADTNRADIAAGEYSAVVETFDPGDLIGQDLSDAFDDFAEKCLDRGEKTHDVIEKETKPSESVGGQPITIRQCVKL